MITGFSLFGALVAHFSLCSAVVWLCTQLCFGCAIYFLGFRYACVFLYIGILAIFADEDSEDENFDCGSDTEYVPNSKDKSASEESDLDDSIALPNRSYSKSTEKV